MIDRPRFPPQHRNRCYCRQWPSVRWLKCSSRISEDSSFSTTSIGIDEIAPSISFAETASRTQYEHLHRALANRNRDSSEQFVITAPPTTRTSLLDSQTLSSLHAICAYRAQHPEQCLSDPQTTAPHDHRCQVRYRLNQLNQPVPVDVNPADGTPRCEICCHPFPAVNLFGLASNRPVLQTTLTHKQTSSSSSHLTSQSTSRRDYSNIVSEPSLILEIHKFGEARGLNLYNDGRRLVDIQIENQQSRPGSLALRHQ